MSANTIFQQLMSVQHAFNDYPADIVYFHGSASLGQNTPLSDIDLAVVANTEVAAGKYLDIELDLALTLEKLTALRTKHLWK
jgi:predicted nucleotidyltransferase